MISNEQVPNVIGTTVYGTDGQKVGKVGHVYYDDRSGTPEFATIRTGMFGGRESFVPLERAQLSEGELSVPYNAQQVKDAPNFDVEEGHLSEQEEEQLYRHYGLSYAASAGEAQTGQAQTGEAASAGAAGTAAAGTTGRAAPASERDAMTRSEERLRVGTEPVETGRARLRKYVVTEDVQQTVPVAREEVRVEREPITEETAGEAARGIGEEEQEVTLHEERPVVSKEEVPVERVRLTKDTATEQQQVSEQLRKERVEEDVPEREQRRR